MLELEYCNWTIKLNDSMLHPQFQYPGLCGGGEDPEDEDNLHHVIE